MLKFFGLKSKNKEKDDDGVNSMQSLEDDSSLRNINPKSRERDRKDSKKKHNLRRGGSLQIENIMILDVKNNSLTSANNVAQYQEFEVYKVILPSKHKVPIQMGVLEPRQSRP